MTERSVAHALSELRRSSLDLRVSLAEADIVWSEVIAIIERGEGVVAASRQMHTTALQCDVSGRLESVIAARHELRLRIMEACIEEGVTLTEFASYFGFSRQQAQRYYRKLKE